MVGQLLILVHNGAEVQTHQQTLYVADTNKKQQNKTIHSNENTPALS